MSIAIIIMVSDAGTPTRRWDTSPSPGQGLWHGTPARQIVTHFSGFWDTEGVQTTILELCSFLLGDNDTTQDYGSKTTRRSRRSALRSRR
jgi:hypothetical protein